MAEGTITATATTINGAPAVQIKPNNVPEGNLGGAGAIAQVATAEEAKEIAKAINEGKLNPEQVLVATKTPEQGKKVDVTG